MHDACDDDNDFFCIKKNVRMAGKNSLARLHAIVSIDFPKKLILVLRDVVRLVVNIEIHMFVFLIDRFSLDGSFECGIIYWTSIHTKLVNY